MLGRLLTRHATGRVARRVPALKFLALGEIAMLMRRHAAHLAPHERRRMATLLAGGARTRSFTDAEREELARLVAKLEPRAFVGNTADALSPVPLPRIVREGRRSRQRARAAS